MGLLGRGTGAPLATDETQVVCTRQGRCGLMSTLVASRG